jgi:hypothetical protein
LLSSCLICDFILATSNRPGTYNFLLFPPEQDDVIYML